MKWKKTACLILVFCLPVTVPAQTVDDILAKYFEARGGYDNLKEVQSSLEVFTINGNVTLTVKKKRPNKIRIDWQTENGHKGAEGFDGKTAWEFNPYDDNPDPTLVEGVPAKALERAASFDDRLMDYREKGTAIEYKGTDTFEDRTMYVLKVTLKDGQQQDYYIDAETYLLRKTYAVIEIHGSKEKKPQTRVLSDYKEVNGFTVPHKIVETVVGGNTEVKVWKSRHFNIDIADSTFSAPKHLE